MEWRIAPIDLKGDTKHQLPHPLERPLVTPYDDVAIYPPAYFLPTVGESNSIPDAPTFLKATHVFNRTWIEETRTRHRGLWAANQP